MNRFHRSLAAAAAALLAALPIAGCTQSRDAPNDCVVAAARAQSELPPGEWSRLLMAKYGESAIGHTYMVYATLDGHLFAYDTVFGSRPIHPRSLAACDVAAVVDPRAVMAWFLEDTPK